MVFVKLSSGVVALKCIESDGRWQFPLDMVQKGGADAAAGVRRMQVELLNPTALIPSRHGDETDHNPVNARNRNTAAGDQFLSDPLADALIGLDQRRAYDEFFARP